MRVWLLALTAALAGGAAAQATPAGQGRPVPCRESIDSTRFPYVGGGYRSVLGALSVPPARRLQVVATGERRWPFWAKAGLVVRGGSPDVTIEVPPAWRNRVAIGWGYARGTLSRLRIAGCPASSKVGLAYSGGFLLSVPTACVPLVFNVGRRSATVRFGLGRTCS